MTRGVWKGPFVHPSLLKKIDKLKDNPGKIVFTKVQSLLHRSAR